MSQRLFDQRINRWIIENITVGIDDSILAMAGIWIQRNVSHDAKIWELFFEFFDRLRDQAIGIKCFFTIGGFKFGPDYWKQSHDWNAKRDAVFGNQHELIKR